MAIRATLCVAAIAAFTPQSVLATDVATATGQDVAIQHEIQCMLLGMQLAASPKPDVAMSGKLMNSFYAGAVFGTSPNVDLEPAIHHEAMALATLNDKPTQIAAIGGKCATEMNARAGQINAALTTLQKMASNAPTK